MDARTHTAEIRGVNSPAHAKRRWQLAVKARVLRLAPLALMMLVALLVPQNTQPGVWLIIVQGLTGAALLLAYLARKHVSLPCGAMLAGLALGTVIVATDTLPLALKAALCITLTLCIANAARWLRRRSWARLLCIASYACGALLLYAATFVTGSQAQLTVTWTVLATCLACTVFISWTEVIDMLQPLSCGEPSADALTPAYPAALDARLEQLELEVHALRASKRDQETFVFAISHDLRAPLRAIDAFSRLLSEHLPQPLTARAKHDLAGIHAGVGRMQELLTCWLDIARCDRAVLRRQDIDVSAMAEALAQELQTLDPTRSVIVTVDADMTSSADPTLVRELLQNLISNAWKFTEGNAECGMVHVGVRHERGETVFYVRDNGIGFDPGSSSDLFVPFSRLSTAARFAGSGLGLAIAQRIVERHQGRIWAEAALGRGATFCFTLSAPLAQLS